MLDGQKKMKVPFVAALLLLSQAAGSVLSEGENLHLRKGMFPTFPACAIQKRVQGIVRIRATLDSTGQVIAAIPVDPKNEPIAFPKEKTDSQFGYECLCNAAQKAASAWAFEKGGKDKDVILLFRFKLVNAVPVDNENLYPVYLAPHEVEIRGLIPLVEVTNSQPK